MFSSRKSIVTVGSIVTAAALFFTPFAVQAQESYGGNIIGGIAGALLGNQVGGGSGRIAATAAGGILGAIVGGNVERGSQYRGPAAVQQQTYYNQYPQQAPQYQQRYNTVTYDQPVYSEPAYVQQSYQYVQPPTSYVYVQRADGRWRDDADRREYRDERHDRRRDYDDHRWDSRRDDR